MIFRPVRGPLRGPASSGPASSGPVSSGRVSFGPVCSGPVRRPIRSPVR